MKHNYWLLLVVALCTSCVTLPDVAPTPDTPANPPVAVGLPDFLYGSVSAGEWPRIDPAVYVRECKATRVNCSGTIEAMAAAYDQSADGFNDMTLDAVVDRLIIWVREMQGAKLFSVIHWANSNDRSLTRWSPATHKRAIERFYDAVGTDYIVLVPVVEDDGEPGAADFAAWTLNYWHFERGGICGFNGSGRPHECPAGYQLIDYHFQALNDYGPDLRAQGIRTYLCSDNGPAINALRGYWDARKIQAWAPEWKAHGCGIGLYQYQTTEIDTVAMSILGDVYGPRESAIVRAAICVGVQTTADGLECPGASRDAATAFEWTRGMQDRRILENRDATIDGIKGHILQVNQEMARPDLLMVTISGHGTTRPDVSGDEANGQDEGVVLFDGVWWDDQIWDFICTLRPCRLLLVTDTCHAEGSWRKVGRALGIAKPDYVQLEIPLNDKRRGEWAGEIIQLAGCREESYSYGSDTAGGTWHQALNRAILNAGSWADLYKRAESTMPSEQQPAWSVYQATPAFINGWDL